MSAKHTPGPWRVCGGSTPHYKAIHSVHGYIIFSMADTEVDRESGKSIAAPDSETQNANARLIAAAPDLLAALKAYQKNNRIHNDTESELYEMAEKAIAKAEGESR